MNKKIIVVCGIICIMLHSQVFALRGLKKPTAQPVPVPAPAPAPAPKPAPAPAPKPAPKPAPANIGALQAELAQTQQDLTRAQRELVAAQRELATAQAAGTMPTGSVEQLLNQILDLRTQIATDVSKKPDLIEARLGRVFDDAIVAPVVVI